MRELIQRLSALDDDAASAMKMIARFDAQGRSMKPHSDAAAILTWPHQFLEDGSDGVVWLERPADRSGSSDAVILERLAAGVHLTIEVPLAVSGVPRLT